jgi:hypothetical protein
MGLRRTRRPVRKGRVYDIVNWFTTWLGWLWFWRLGITFQGVLVIYLDRCLWVGLKNKIIVISHIT